MRSKGITAAFFKLFSRATKTRVIATHLRLATDKGLDGLMVVVPVAAAWSVDVAIVALVGSMMRSELSSYGATFFLMGVTELDFCHKERHPMLQPIERPGDPIGW